jgi:hypothetical protein
MREGVEKSPLFLNKHPDPAGWNVDLVACTAKKKVERISLPCAEKKLQSWSVCECKCPAHPFAVTRKRVRTVEITHLETVDERRASLEIVLGDAVSLFRSTSVCRIGMFESRKA